MSNKDSSLREDIKAAMRKASDAPVYDALRNLKDSTDELNALSAEINETIKDVEDTLTSSYHMGISVFIDAPNPNSALKLWSELGYAKTSKGWRLVAMRRGDSDTAYSDDQVKPLAECPRDIRFRMVKHVPELLLALNEEVEQQISDAKEALNAVTESDSK